MNPNARPLVRQVMAASPNAWWTGAAIVAQVKQQDNSLGYADVATALRWNATGANFTDGHARVAMEFNAESDQMKYRLTDHGKKDQGVA
jgi:hypothetical protein